MVYDIVSNKEPYFYKKLLINSNIILL